MKKFGNSIKKMIDGRKTNFRFFFDNGISNEFGMLIIYLKPKNEIIGSKSFYSFDEKIMLLE